MNRKTMISIPWIMKTIIKILVLEVSRLKYNSEFL